MTDSLTSSSRPTQHHLNPSLGAHEDLTRTLDFDAIDDATTKVRQKTASLSQSKFKNLISCLVVGGASVGYLFRDSFKAIFDSDSSLSFSVDKINKALNGYTLPFVIVLGGVFAFYGCRKSSSQQATVETSEREIEKLPSSTTSMESNLSRSPIKTKDALSPGTPTHNAEHDASTPIIPLTPDAKLQKVLARFTIPSAVDKDQLNAILMAAMTEFIQTDKTTAFQALGAAKALTHFPESPVRDKTPNVQNYQLTPFVAKLKEGLPAKEGQGVLKLLGQFDSYRKRLKEMLASVQKTSLTTVADEKLSFAERHAELRAYFESLKTLEKEYAQIREVIFNFIDALANYSPDQEPCAHCDPAQLTTSTEFRISSIPPAIPASPIGPKDFAKFNQRVLGIGPDTSATTVALIPVSTKPLVIMPQTVVLGTSDSKTNVGFQTPPRVIMTSKASNSSSQSVAEFIQGWIALRIIPNELKDLALIDPKALPTNGYTFLKKAQTHWKAEQQRIFNGIYQRSRLSNFFLPRDDESFNRELLSGWQEISGALSSPDNKDKFFPNNEFVEHAKARTAQLEKQCRGVAIPKDISEINRSFSLDYTRQELFMLLHSFKQFSSVGVQPDDLKNESKCDVEAIVSKHKKWFTEAQKFVQETPAFEKMSTHIQHMQDEKGNKVVCDGFIRACYVNEPHKQQRIGQFLASTNGIIDYIAALLENKGDKDYPSCQASLYKE